MSQRITIDEYREQLRKLAGAMAHGRCDEVQPFLAEGFEPVQLEMFIEDNVSKRQDKLKKQVEFLADIFDEQLDDLIKEYAEGSALEAYDSGFTDGVRFLTWLESNHSLTPEERDYVRCQRARSDVEAESRVNRMGYVRFQELWSLAPELVDELEENQALQIYLNPIRSATRFETTVLLGENAIPPMDVIFFAVGTEISTAVLESTGMTLVSELAALYPCTLKAWEKAGREIDREERIATCRDLAEMGLIAFG